MGDIFYSENNLTHLMCATHSWYCYTSRSMTVSRLNCHYDGMVRPLQDLPVSDDFTQLIALPCNNRFSEVSGSHNACYSCYGRWCKWHDSDKSSVGHQDPIYGELEMSHINAVIVRITHFDCLSAFHRHNPWNQEGHHTGIR